MRQDWAQATKRRKIDFDVQHQVARLRVGKSMSDQEAERIFSALAQGVRTYEQVVEVRCDHFSTFILPD